MFISHVYYKEIGVESIKPVCIADHAKRYFTDLYRSYKMPLAINKKETVYAYDEMASFLFDVEYNQTLCAQSDYLFFPSWAWVFDSNDAMPELSLKHQFKWGGSILDIRDCGSLCVYYALHIMLKLYQNHAINHASCCSIEGEFKPCMDSDDQLFPEINYVGLLSVSSCKNVCSDLQVMYCDIHRYDQDYTQYQTVILKTVNHLVALYHIVEHDYRIFLRSGGDEAHLPQSIELISHPLSSGFMYRMLNQIQIQPIAKQVNYFFIIDLDLKAQFYGVLLIKIGGRHVDSVI